MRGFLTLLVVLLLAAGFLLLRSHVGPEPDVGDEWERSVGPNETPPQLRTEPAGRGEARASSGTGERPAGAGGTGAFAGIRGVVEDERGRGLPGATVRLEALDPGVFRGAATAAGEPLATTTATAGGAFTLELDVHRWVRVVASLEGHASVGARVAGPGTTVRLVLPLAASLTVAVVDVREAPVVGARVEGLGRGATHALETDERGLAHFDALAPGPVSFSVLADGGRRARVGPVVATPAGARTLTVLLPDAVAVAGVVTDADTGRGVSGAEVHVAQPGLAFAAEPTGPDGAFGPLAAGAAGARVLLAVRAPGYAPQTTPVVLPLGARVHRVPPVALRPAPPWKGRVVDASGRPVADAQVGYTSAGVAGRAPPTTRTDAEGRFALPSPSPPAPGRRVMLTAQAAGGSAARALRPGDTAPANLVLVLAGGYAVTGRVVSTEGDALAGVSVRLEPRWSEIADRRRPGPETARLLALGETARLALTTVTDEGGWWRVNAVPDGTYDARLLLDGRTDFTDEPLQVAGADADAGVLRFGDGHAVHGAAWDVDGPPLPGVEIVLRDAGGSPRLRRATTDAEGAWRLDGVPAGSWRLTALRPDRARVVLDVEVPRSDPLDLELGLGTRLSGQVLDGNGRPWRGVFTVRLEGESTRGRVAATSFRDAQGRFLLEGILPGTWAVRVTTPGGALGRALAPVEVRPGAAFDVTIELGEGASIGGTLRRIDGKGVGGGRILLVHETRGTTHTLATSSDGRFGATGLDEGTWRLVASGRGGASVIERVDLAAGGRRDVDVVLGPVSAVAVTVRGTDGRPRSAATVLVRPIGAPASRPDTVPRTDASGRVVLADVPLGGVRIDASTRDGEKGQVEIDVTADSPTTVEIVVRPKARPRTD